MRLLNICLVCSSTLLLATLGCGDHTGSRGNRPDANAPYIVKETLATGDTGITKLAGIKKVNALDIICQHWEVGKTEGATSAELMRDEAGDKAVPGLDLFNDSSYVANPRGDISIGTWRIKQEGKEMTLVLRQQITRKPTGISMN